MRYCRDAGRAKPRIQRLINDGGAFSITSEFSSPGASLGGSVKPASVDELRRKSIAAG